MTGSTSTGDSRLLPSLVNDGATTRRARLVALRGKVNAESHKNRAKKNLEKKLARD
jgi:hypothetical protein